MHQLLLDLILTHIVRCYQIVIFLALLSSCKQQATNTNDIATDQATIDKGKALFMQDCSAVPQLH
jgi:hypothetical protein